MAEAVASQTGGEMLWAIPYSPSAERLREQVTEFEELVETMLKRYEQQEKELRETKEERDRLKAELERRKGE